MKKIIILQGPPASGKSTIAKKLHEEDNSRVIVSRDSIREARGEYWIPNQERYISDVEEFMVVAALEHGLTPIIDATNLNKNTLAKWEVLADLHEAEIEYVKCIVPYDEALVRDKNRKRPVGEKVVTDFYNRYFPEMVTKVEE